MKTDPPTVALILLAPENTGGTETARDYAAQLADILNTEQDLPPELKRQPDAPPETADSVLAFASEWCRERNALSFAVVLEGGVVAGSISLSHIDAKTGHGRTGYFIASKFQGRGVGTRALSLLLDIARKQGMRRITASIPQANVASRRIWEKCGAPVELTDNAVTAVLDGDYTPRF